MNGEIKRRTEVVGIFPNEAAITRLAGAVLLEQNDEWAVQHARYMTLETINPMSDDPPRQPASRGRMTSTARANPEAVRAVSDLTESYQSPRMLTHGAFEET